uniref:Secreted protein n=1 Tax=Cucumis melo TaxID=3656 RepID=A0A9I9E8N2_CUCME
MSPKYRILHPIALQLLVTCFCGIESLYQTCKVKLSPLYQKKTFLNVCCSKLLQELLKWSGQQETFPYLSLPTIMKLTSLMYLKAAFSILGSKQTIEVYFT